MFTLLTLLTTTASAQTIETWDLSRSLHPFPDSASYDDARASLAADFPNLTMIMGHAGHDWWADCLAVARGHPNMVLDLSGWQLRLRDGPEEALHAIDRMRNVVGIDRLLWGNDFPGPRERISLKECKEVFQRLPSMAAEHGYSFSDADVQAILGTNAQSLLKLP